MNKEKQIKMRNEIIEKRKEVVSDMLNFSVGEIVNLYRDKEIDLEPAFQRLFRWTSEQQTKFIESLLLGYPVPAIFVYQKEDGVWEVIDGVQRISSILNFMGLLEDEGLPLLLEKGDMLKELENKCWDDKTYLEFIKNKKIINDRGLSVEDISPIDKATAIDLKRSRIPVIILSNKSIETSKLELFKRLNSGGSHLAAQEIRNALIYMTDVNKFNEIENFSKNQIFRSVIRLDDNGEKLSFDMEVITRYLILANSSTLVSPSSKENAEDFYDKSIESILKNKDINIFNQLEFFKNLLQLIYDKLDNEYGFRIYNNTKKTFKGSFSWFVFETVIYGALKNKSIFEEKNSELIEEYINKVKKLELPSIQGKKTLDRMLNISKQEAERNF